MHQARAEHLYALLSEIEPELASPALRPLERLLARSGAGDGLIVAMVGASGVGRSELINRLAGAGVVATGPLRPTTTETLVWGDVDLAYLPGRRVFGPNRPDHLVLVDTPPVEHDPDAVVGLLHLVDGVVFVISPDRYADAITANLSDTVHELGIPTRVVLTTAESSASDLERVVHDAEANAGGAIDAVVSADVEPLRALLVEMVQSRDEILEQRDRAAAVFAARRASEVAEVLAKRSEAAQVAVERADTAFSEATIDRSELASTAALAWDEASAAIAGLAREATDRAIAGWAAGSDLYGIGSPDVGDPSLGLPDVDTEPIDGWHRTTVDIGRSATRHRRLHPRRSRTVRDQLWRLSIDFDHRPTEIVRKALRDRIPDLRIERHDAFIDAIRRAGLGRIETLKAHLDPPKGTTPERIRGAADALAGLTEHSSMDVVTDDA